MSLAALAGLYALFAALVPVERGPTICPFRIVTGRRCPLCGLTRASRALTRGDIRGMLRLHPLTPLLWAAVTIRLWTWRSDTTFIHMTHPMQQGGL